MRGDFPYTIYDTTIPKVETTAATRLLIFKNS